LGQKEYTYKGQVQFGVVHASSLLHKTRSGKGREGKVFEKKMGKQGPSSLKGTCL